MRKSETAGTQVFSSGLVGAANSRVLAVADCTNTVLTIWHSGCASCILLCQTNPNRPKASPLWGCLVFWAHEELWLGGGDCYRDFGHKQVFPAMVGHARWRFSCSQMRSAVCPLENEAMKGSLTLFKLLQTNVYEVDNTVWELHMPRQQELETKVRQQSCSHSECWPWP